MFNTISQYGGDTLKPLLKKVTCQYPTGGEVEDYAFYNHLKGTKTLAKHKILNQVFTACALTWKSKHFSGKKSLQPSSFVNYMKLLSYVFKKKGILYQFDEYFNARGKFHGVAIDHWHKIQKQDPTFSTGVNFAEFIQDYNKHMHQIIMEGKLNYLKDPIHLCNHMVLCAICAIEFTSVFLPLNSVEVYCGTFLQKFKGKNKDVMSRTHNHTFAYKHMYIFTIVHLYMSLNVNVQL
jgi:hypothetical protein